MMIDNVQVFWTDNPRDLQLLRHDKSLHTIKTKPQLKNVPDYLGLQWTCILYNIILRDTVLHAKLCFKILLYEVLIFQFRRALKTHLFGRVTRVFCALCTLPPYPPLDNIRVMVIVCRLRGNIIRTALCWVV